MNLELEFCSCLHDNRVHTITPAFWTSLLYFQRLVLCCVVAILNCAHPLHRLSALDIFNINVMIPLTDMVLLLLTHLHSLRCIACDFKVCWFDKHVWHARSDYLYVIIFLNLFTCAFVVVLQSLRVLCVFSFFSSCSLVITSSNYFAIILRK